MEIRRKKADRSEACSTKSMSREKASDKCRTRSTKGDEEAVRSSKSGSAMDKKSRADKLSSEMQEKEKVFYGDENDCQAGFDPSVRVIVVFI